MKIEGNANGGRIGFVVFLTLLGCLSLALFVSGMHGRAVFGAAYGQFVWLVFGIALMTNGAYFYFDLFEEPMIARARRPLACFALVVAVLVVPVVHTFMANGVQHAVNTAGVPLVAFGIYVWSAGLALFGRRFIG